MEACSHREFLSDPARDFTRDRKLPLKTMLDIIISMEGQSITKELKEHFNEIATSSAFIQQRDKICRLKLNAVLGAWGYKKFFRRYLNDIV